MINKSNTLGVLFFTLILIVGTALLAINIYGLFQPLRPAIFFNDELRFANDQPISFQESLLQIPKNKGESQLGYVIRMNELVAKSLAHIHWLRYEPQKFNQLVPIWENYILYAMGRYTDIPEYQRYHFANYQRSLKRGIGVCGDAAMILSQILNKQKIDNKIISFPGHVLVEAQITPDKSLVLDPDFGVVLPMSLTQLNQEPTKTTAFYLEQGYTANDIKLLLNEYNKPYKAWDGVKHFITKKYFFEKISYFLKWPLPIALILISLLFFLKKDNPNETN